MSQPEDLAPEKPKKHRKYHRYVRPMTIPKRQRKKLDVERPPNFLSDHINTYHDLEDYNKEASTTPTPLRVHYIRLSPTGLYNLSDLYPRADQIMQALLSLGARNFNPGNEQIGFPLGWEFSLPVDKEDEWLRTKEAMKLHQYIEGDYDLGEAYSKLVEPFPTTDSVPKPDESGAILENPSIVDDENLQHLIDSYPADTSQPSVYLDEINPQPPTSPDAADFSFLKPDEDSSEIDFSHYNDENDE